MAKVQLKGLKKAYLNGYQAVHSLDIDIDHGEMLVLVGPSGCGKSTLLRMIAGLESISDGDLLIDGHRVNELEPGERDIAMVFQNYALYPHMSVFDNMAYGLKIRGMSKEEIHAQVEQTAELLELGALLARKPGQLSGGQRQRVAMGRAIVRHPRLFLFDEPLSNLDAKLRGQMRLEIKRLQRRLDTTAVYVTHDQVEAMTLADRLVVLNQGRVEQIGQPMEVYRRPASLFVAQFIGSPAMNVIPAHIVGGELVLAGGQSLALPAGYEDGEVMLGMRPENLRLTGPGEGLKVELVMQEALGAERLYYCRLPGSEQQLVIRLEVEGDPVLTEGDLLFLAIEPERLHLFSAHSGRRLEPNTVALRAVG
ncbi:sn-glycerol 3-phosphate transport system ATP-binding protein [Oceanisphaera litoralis]|uniref:sn-glycerol-3-phosphate ABC transporter ATP-binding protein UgpC n=1 Tax=Oceanisphaera litoralis TaxID=225144 RepID=UPI00195A22F9|nr:sn-glycerol-3-phosphate ABC transporter ATP-binding protein UgpC [Oceanisphaera litoralis]MBM7456421.1 sn-glycerol 3-phosphate transport system ATP-binding protein [Oceanisphaera litoralis]